MHRMRRRQTCGCRIERGTVRHAWCVWLAATIIVVVLGAPTTASAQADEIQVYDGGLAPVGTFNLTLHNNFTPQG